MCSQPVRTQKDFCPDSAAVSIKRVGQSPVFAPNEDDWGVALRSVIKAVSEEEPLERAAEWPQVEREGLLP